VYRFSQTPLWKEIVEDGKEKIFKNISEQFIWGCLGQRFLSPKLRADGDRKATQGGLLGVLVDTTLCIGCRSCEAACAEINNLPAPHLDDARVFEKKGQLLRLSIR
jgi:NAD-dependent dihydropyrimidine dehydrogenase PreA subunit